MSRTALATPKRHTVSLILTEHCNLACTYCYEHPSDRHALGLSTAQDAIRTAFAAPGFDEVEIDFFGGEPFVAFRRLSEICEWVWATDWPKPYICFATTNGTLVHGRIRAWVERNAHRLVLGLSADGTPAMHDRNRSGSSSDIDFAFFARTWPQQTVKMTLSPATVGELAAGVIHLHGLGFKVACNPAHGSEWNPSHSDALERQLRVLADYYLAHPQLEPATILSMPIEYAFAARPDSNYCGAGRGMVSYDRHGHRYPCPTFMPMTTGTTEGSLDTVFADLASQRNVESPGCADCWLLPVCPTCYGINWVNRGDPFVRDRSHCEFARIRARATAYMAGQMLLRDHEHYRFLETRTADERAFLAEAAARVQHEGLHARGAASSLSA
jgi:radical SAM protein with 4Fe4S-binding SPASM domain